MISRFLSVVEKEFKTVLKDKIFLFILFVAPVMALAVFGYTFQQNIDHLPTVIIDSDNSLYSKYVIAAAQQSDYFNVLSVNQLSLNESLEKLRKSEIRAVIYIQKGFKDNLDNATTSDIFFYVDSSDYTIYNTLRAAIGGVIKDSLQEISLKIIGDLELEKNENLNKVDEIKNLSNEIESKVDSMKSQVDDINSQFSTFHSMLNSSKQDMEDAQAQLSQMNITIDINSMFDFDKYESLLNENEAKANKLKADSDSLFAKYNNITATVNGVDLQFKTLKKEFLTHPVELKDTYEFGKISYFTYLSAGIISLTLFFMCVLLTSMGVIGEKEKKTLFRLATTPLKKSELITGKFFTFFIVGLIESIWAVLFTIFLFKINYVGSLFNVFIILSLLVAVSVGIGLLISVLVRTMRQALIIIPVLISVPLLMSQTFAPIEVMPKFMQYFAKATPTFYANVALREVMIKGSSIIEIWPEIAILAGYTIFVLLLGILLLKKRIN